MRPRSWTVTGWKTHLHHHKIPLMPKQTLDKNVCLAQGQPKRKSASPSVLLRKYPWSPDLTDDDLILLKWVYSVFHSGYLYTWLESKSWFSCYKPAWYVLEGEIPTYPSDGEENLSKPTLVRRNIETLAEHAHLQFTWINPPSTQPDRRPESWPHSPLQKTSNCREERCRGGSWHPLSNGSNFHLPPFCCYVFSFFYFSFLYSLFSNQ